MTEKIVVDGMLGNIAKWLRLLGIDVHYERNMDDDKLLELALKENAILITGDEELSYKAFRRRIKAIYIRSKLPKAIAIKQILAELNLKKDDLKIGSRCIACNNLLKPIKKETLIGKIPDKVLEFNHEFWYCERCDKIYWYGSHWRNIEKELKVLFS
ncbi:MAG TPA: Mut7-C RNAse domain-containing protein [Geobacterales bacterium]|nr:Mut7-C RNAse domain-containing protein [Geobacterales bacterium]